MEGRGERKGKAGRAKDSVERRVEGKISLEENRNNSYHVKTIMQIFYKPKP